MHVSPADEWTPQTPEEGVMHAFMRIGRRMRAKQPGDTLDPSTHFVLYTLRCGGPIRLSDLATRMEIDASTVSRHVRSLELAGLVDRSPDPDDGRAFQVGLTAAGNDHLDAAMQRKNDLLARAMEGWKTTDVTTFERLMNQFADGVSKIADESADRRNDKEHR